MFFIEHKKYSGKKYLLLKEILSFILNNTLETIFLIAIIKIMVLRVITLKKNIKFREGNEMLKNNFQMRDLKWIKGLKFKFLAKYYFFILKLN